MLQARGMQQPGPVTELCRWVTEDVLLKNRQSREEEEEGPYKHTHTGMPTHALKDALRLKNTSPHLKRPNYSCCSSQ